MNTIKNFILISTLAFFLAGCRTCPGHHPEEFIDYRLLDGMTNEVFEPVPGTYYYPAGSSSRITSRRTLPYKIKYFGVTSMPRYCFPGTGECSGQPGTDRE